MVISDPFQTVFTKPGAADQICKVWKLLINIYAKSFTSLDCSSWLENVSHNCANSFGILSEHPTLNPKPFA
jgi:hypothetical protein